MTLAEIGHRLDRKGLEEVTNTAKPDTIRTAPLPEDVQAALKTAQIAKLPEWAGRCVTLEKQ